MRRECRERFSPPPTSKEAASQRPRHASRHVRDARTVMHVGIAYPRWRGKGSRHAQTAILRIWQEAHCNCCNISVVVSEVVLPSNHVSCLTQFCFHYNRAAYDVCKYVGTLWFEDRIRFVPIMFFHCHHYTKRSECIDYTQLFPDIFCRVCV